ncbi:hypothetical protein UT300017_02980 [Clostridium sp. CTA-17]
MILLNSLIKNYDRFLILKPLHIKITIMVVLHFMLQYLIIVYVVKFFNKKYGDLYVILYMSIII